MWYHIKCAHFSRQQYKAMLEGNMPKKKDTAKLHWFCQDCEDNAPDIMKTLSLMNAIQKDLEKRVQQLEIKIDV